jgi:hypothetical protein
MTNTEIIAVYEKLPPHAAFDYFDTIGVAVAEIADALGEARASEFRLWQFVNPKEVGTESRDKYFAEILGNGRIISAEQSFLTREAALEWIRTQVFGNPSAKAVLNEETLTHEDVWPGQMVEMCGNAPDRFLPFHDEATREKAMADIAANAVRYGRRAA